MKREHQNLVAHSKWKEKKKIDRARYVPYFGGIILIISFNQ